MEQTSKVNLYNFQTGDKMLLRNEKADKLDSLWTGPYTIVEVNTNGTNVVLELTKRKRIKVHINRLKKCHSEN